MLTYQGKAFFLSKKLTFHIPFILLFSTVSLRAVQEENKEKVYNNV